MSFGFIAPKTKIKLFGIAIFYLPHTVYSINVPCALTLITTFLSFINIELVLNENNMLVLFLSVY